MRTLRAIALACIFTASIEAQAPGTRLPAKNDGIDPLWKDIVEVATWAVAIFAGVVTASKAIAESRANREQRERALIEAREARDQRARELRWRQAQIGGELVDRMLNEPLAWDAMQMLDWEKLDLHIEGKPVPVSLAIVLHALRPSRDGSGPMEKRIRDAFDALFHRMARLENSIVIDLTTLDDVSLPIEYYVCRMAAHHRVYEAYMQFFGHGGALRLARRFKCWTDVAGGTPASGKP